MIDFRQKLIERKLLLINKAARLLFPDYRLCWPQLDWWQNPEFNSYLDRFCERDGFNTQRKWMLSQLLRMVVDVPGDTAECGVFMGASSWLICNANQKLQKMKKKHHMFDSFEGLSCPNSEDGAFWREGDLAVVEDSVKRNLSAFDDDINIYKGWIPERFNDVKDLTFSFVHIDVDLYQPTKDSLIFFYERLNQGGIILCDDYGFSSCPGATKAVNEFLANKKEGIIHLDSGGGFIIKGVNCGD